MRLSEAYMKGIIFVSAESFLFFHVPFIDLFPFLWYYNYIKRIAKHQFYAKLEN